MAVRLTRCPKCECSRQDVLKEHNPKTTDLNMRATLKCRQCEHEFEARITSHHTKNQRRRGRLI